MKFSRLLVLSALCLTTTGAMADIVNGVRQRPAATAETEWQMETTYYLYNVQARQFFVGGNDYNTRASISPKGYKVKFHDPLDAAPIPETVEIQDSVETQKAWKCTFSTEDGGAIWVDNSSQTYRFWTIENLQNGVFRISNQHLAEVAEAIQGKCLGWNGNEGDTRLYFIDPATEGAGIDWQFVSEANYQNYQNTWEAMKDQFEKAAELKTFLDQAKEMKIDVADEEAVYLNEDATVDQLAAAIIAVQTKINNAQAGNASVSNPANMTGSILNPNFDNASYDGWKGTAPNMTGSGAHGPANVAEHYNKNFDTYQDLNAMPKGVYKLEASTAFRTTWEDHANHTNYVANLYAKVDGDTLTSPMQNLWDAMNIEPKAGPTDWGVEATELSEVHDGVTYYIPDDPSAGRLYFEAGYYHNQLFFALDGNDPIRLGVMKNKSVTGSDWVLFDSFKLTFYGGAPEAYQFWVNQTPKIKFDENSKISKQYLQAYNASFEQTATNKAEAIAAVKNIKAAEDSIVKNMSLWNELAKEFENAQLYTVGQYAGLISADDLGDYLMDVEDTYISIEDNENRTQSNAELEAIIAKLKEMVNTVEAEYKNQVQPGTDMTEYLKSPGFEDGKGGATSAGWTVESKGGGNVQLGGNANNHCYEAWHSTNFDVWQEVTDLPIGVYEIEVQGYVRYLDGQDAIAAKGMEPENVPIYVYMNDSKTNFVSWFSYPKSEEFYTAVSGAKYLTDGDGWCYPDNMIAASAAFADGGYKQSAKGLVANSGDVLRIGVKGTPVAKFWPIFDNFKLTYLGFDASVVRPELEKKIAEAVALSTVPTTKTAKGQFDAAYADALNKLTSEDGTEMFKALAALTKACNAFEDGAALCKELAAKIEEMMTIAQQAVSSHASDALTYGGQLQGQLEASELEAEDIEAAKETIRGYILLMQLPENYQEGSAEGVDVTAFIQTPDFQKTVEGVETNSIEGWEGTTGYNFGNDATQRGALALEFYEKKFDMYQEIKGAGEVVLPNGNYIVSVNAFERVSSDTPAFFYANDQVVELMKLEDGVDTEAGEVAPNNMVSAVEAFNEGKYLRTLAVTVTDNKLRIGIKHENSNGGDWVIMDNFKLYFYGSNETPVADSVDMLTANSNKTMKVEFYTLDGRRVSGLQKGITIRKAIMENGNVVVKKIRK